ncbi:hypothetical protein [Mucilaginibacter lappiensis]|uniref:Uncharacterized protein n=1 Tax=Mucilaginibacter lappiensis TaxID=354630 RepID=A0A841JRF0_9SPHI|nr:hypothetical protein [Mucilaginibacter lappiensis]MBB6131348.1 hypothetical protein [Mucilaginibacter lappiensis]
MPNFIELLEISQGNALKVRINIDHISSYGEKINDPQHRKVRLSGGFEIVVTQTLPEIAALIKQAQ